MKNKILSYLLGWVFAVLFGIWWLWINSVEAATCGQGCENGIKLNTCFPIIWDCIDTWSPESSPTNAFPYMMWALTKIVMALVLVVCFIFIIIAWIKRSSDDPKWAKDIIKKVAVTVLLLWFSWVILRWINPNFFG